MLFFPALCCRLVEKLLSPTGGIVGRNLCDCQMYLGIAQKSLDLFYPTSFSLFLSFYSFIIKKVDFSHVCNLRGSRLKSVSPLGAQQRVLPALFARVDIIDSYALLTADVAAPVEDTVALLFPFLSPCIVPAAAAQKVATINPMGSDITDPVTGPKGTCLRVGLTKVWWVLIVNQVLLSWSLEEVVFGPEGLDPATGFSMFFHHHFRSAIVLVLEVVTDDPEVWLRPPAGLHLAAAWEAVTFALKMHEFNNRLKKSRGKAKKMTLACNQNTYCILLFSQDFLKNCSVFIDTFTHLWTKITLSSSQCPAQMPGLRQIKPLQLYCFQWLSLIPTPALSNYQVLSLRDEEISVHTDFYLINVHVWILQYYRPRTQFRHI